MLDINICPSECDGVNNNGTPIINVYIGYIQVKFKK